MIRITSRASGRAPFDSFVVASILTVRRAPGDLAPCIRHLYLLLGRQPTDYRSLPWKGERQQRADRGSFSPKLAAQDARDDPPNKEHTRRGNAHQHGSEQQRDPSESQDHDQEYKESKAERP